MRTDAGAFETRDGLLHHLTDRLLFIGRKDASTAGAVEEDGAVDAVEVESQRHVSECSFGVNKSVAHAEQAFGRVKSLVDEARIANSSDVV